MGDRARGRKHIGYEKNRLMIEFSGLYLKLIYIERPPIVWVSGTSDQELTS